MLINLIALRPETLLAQCLPPAPVIVNGSFESGDYPCTAPLDAFAYGCVDDWFAGSQSPTIFEEFSVTSSFTVTPQQGDYFALCAAFNDPVAEVCRHEAIVQEIDLIPGLSYRLQFYASTVSPSPYDDPLELNVYFTSGLTNAPTTSDLRTASPYLSNEVLEAMLESGMTTGKKDSLAKINAPLAFILMALAEAELSAPAYAHIEYLRETQGVSAMEILQSELSDLERRRTAAIDAMVKDHISKLEIGAADTLLMNEGEIKKRIGLKLYTGDLEAAQTLLNTLPADDYRAVQQINIDRLDEGNNYELERPDAEDLEEIAAKVSPEAAYAQALLILLRGDTFALQLPEEEESLVRPHLPGVQSVLSAAVLKVQPNPTRGQVEIILPGDITASGHQEGRLELYDLKGQLIRTTALTGPSTTWQIGELPDGVYLLRYTNGEAVLAVKVIIQH